MSKTKQPITVAVSGLNNHDNPGPGVPIIRALRESEAFDCRIIGLSYETMEPAIYLHETVDKSYQVPYPSAGQENLLLRLQHIQAIENIEFLFPLFDAELFSYLKLQGDLGKIGINMILPTLSQFEERQKGKLFEFGEKYGIKVPVSAMINSLSEVHYLPSRFQFPMVVKGRFYEAYVAYTTDQVTQYFNKISAKWGLPVIIQQFVQGSEYNVVALGDGEGNTVGAVPMRKTYITDKGKAWAGVTIDDKSLVEMTRELMQATKWKGGLELEMIKASTGEIYLLEINPRFPAWTYLAVGAGQNLPEAAIKIGLGQEVEPFENYDIGKMFIRYSWDHICDLKEFEQISTMGEL